MRTKNAAGLCAVMDILYSSQVVRWYLQKLFCQHFMNVLFFYGIEREAMVCLFVYDDKW